MRAIIVGLLIGLTSLCFAQNEDIKLLSEVEIHARNYNYLKSVKSNDKGSLVNSLEQKVANFDVKSLNLDKDKYETYKVLFFIPNGKISAVYDNDSQVMRTVEKFSDVPLPIPVVKSVLKKYPGCSISGDDYFVWYRINSGAIKRYKITLIINEKKLKIKTDENGTIL